VPITGIRVKNTRNPIVKKYFAFETRPHHHIMFRIAALQLLILMTTGIVYSISEELHTQFRDDLVISV
jgi:hypothetical protein